MRREAGSLDGEMIQRMKGVVAEGQLAESHGHGILVENSFNRQLLFHSIALPESKFSGVVCVSGLYSLARKNGAF